MILDLSKSSQNESKMTPKSRKNAPRTPPKTTSKIECEIYAKIPSKWSPKASPKPLKRANKTIKTDPGAPEGPEEVPGLNFDVRSSILDLKLITFGAHCPLLGVHVFPKGGRRDPALRAE